MSRRVSMRAKRRRDVAAGVTAVALVLAVVYLVFGGPLPFRSGHEIDAVLERAGDLRTGAPVRIAGVDVGEVVEIGRGPGTTARVRMRLQERALPLHRDATLKVRPRLFLEGNFFVDLHPGTPAARQLEDGGTIPLGQTALPVQLDQVLSTLKSDTRDDLRRTVRELGGGLHHGGARALNRGLRAAPGANAGLAILAREARGRRARDLERLIADGERVVAVLEDNRAELAGLLTAFRRTADALAADTGALSASVSGLAATVREAEPALGDVRAALPSLRAVAADARPLLRRLPATLDLAQPLLEEAGELVHPRELPDLLADARPALGDAAALAPLLRELFARVEPVAACVRDNALPVLTASVDDPPHTTGRPVWQELLAGMVGLASGSQNFDANGPAVRYLATAGEQLFSLGELGSATELFATGPEPLAGSRPARPDRQPPFRPDAPCAEQERVDLRAATTPPPPTRRVTPRRPSAEQARRLLRREARRAGVQRGAAGEEAGR